MFAVGTDSAVYRRTFSGSWGGWVRVGGQWTSGPAAVGRAIGVVDVFVRGGDNAAWQIELRG